MEMSSGVHPFWVDGPANYIGIMSEITARLGKPTKKQLEQWGCKSLWGSRESSCQVGTSRLLHDISYVIPSHAMLIVCSCSHWCVMWDEVCPILWGHGNHAYKHVYICGCQYMHAYIYAERERGRHAMQVQNATKCVCRGSHPGSLNPARSSHHSWVRFGEGGNPQSTCPSCVGASC